MRPLYLPGEEATQRRSPASQGSVSGRAAQSPSRQQQGDWQRRQPSNSSSADPDAMQFPANGTLMRQGGVLATYAPAESSWADPRRGNGAVTPSMEAAATVAAEVLSSSQTGEIMVAADFTEVGMCCTVSRSPISEAGSSGVT